MNKDTLRNFALKLLEDLDIESVESIGITEDVYGDDSPYTTISIDYKTEGGEK